jgi:hypothetical protein
LWELLFAFESIKWLVCVRTAGKLIFMTTVAARLLRDFEKLAPEEQLLVRERVISMTESIQQRAMQSLRAASEGKQLLSELLVDRVGERARGRQ